MQPRLAMVVVLLGIALAARGGLAQELAPVSLPAPQTEGGMPLMQALKLRATARAFAPDPLPRQTLANLLWAAWGINRPQVAKALKLRDNQLVVFAQSVGFPKK